MSSTPTLTPPSGVTERPPERRWGPLIVVAVVVALVAGSIGSWIGSGTSDDSIATVDLPPIVDGFVDAMTAGDAEALVGVLTEDGTLGFLCEGASGAAVRSVLTMDDFFGYVTFTEMTPRTVIEEGDTVAIAWRWSGTSSTEARVASDQTPFSAPVITIMRIEDGLIARSDAYCVYEDIIN